MNTRMNNDDLIVTTSRTAEDILHDDLCSLDHEEAWILYLTSRNSVIGKEMVSRGTVNSTSIDCRTVLRNALLNNAAGIILFHNHPSGNPSPGAADVRFTKKLHDACSLMDIRLLDHIIVSGERFYSFDEEKTYRHI